MPRLKQAVCVVLASSCLISAAFAQTFSITASVPISVTQGSSGTSVITITPSGGFTGSVALATMSAGLPTGATSVFSLASVPAPYSNGSTLTITTTPATPPGNYSITVTGSSNALSVSVPVSLTVESPAAAQAISAANTLKSDFGFGVALGLSYNATGSDIVTNATVDANGIVRVNTRDNTTAGFMLETHYYVFPRPKPGVILGTDVDQRTWGVGPFVAAQPGTSQVISAVGAGLMLGFRRPKGTTPTGFGLGLGYEAIPAAQVLGGGFVNGQKAPVDSSGSPLPIQYETEDKGALLVVLSVAF